MSDAQLELAAEILGPLLDEVVFVGGATVNLWLSDPGAPPARVTDDVDVICEVTSRLEYHRLGDRLRDRGLREAIDERVICRWRHGETGLAIDVMPPVEEILGFSNPWYEPAIATSQQVVLDSGTTIRAATPPLMVATKLSAWKGRGNGDILKSLDIHDVLILIDGRPELSEELEAAEASLRSFVAAELEALRREPYFAYAVQSATAAYGVVAAERADIVAARLEAVLTRLAR